MSHQQEYFIVTKCVGGLRSRSWTWEIRRRSRPSGYYCAVHNFKTEPCGKAGGRKRRWQNYETTCRGRGPRLTARAEAPPLPIPGFRILITVSPKLGS